MIGIVTVIAPLMSHIISCKGECAFHVFICFKQVAAINVQVISTVLQENTDWLWFIFADQYRVPVAPA